MKKYFLKILLLVIIDFLLIYLCIIEYPYDDGFPIFLFIFLLVFLLYTLKDIANLIQIYNGQKIIESNTEYSMKVLVITWIIFIMFSLMCILIIIFGEKEVIDMGIFSLIGLLVSSYYLIIIYERKKKRMLEH